MWRLYQLIVFLSYFQLLQADSSSSIHIRLVRRSGRFACHENVNLDVLLDNLIEAEDRYVSTRRDVENNRLARKWVSKDDTLDEDALLTSTELRGPWFASIGVGDPPQMLEFDVDMLSPDFYTLMTTSEKGSRYDTFISQTHADSEERVHQLCRNPTDVFHLSQTLDPVRLVFPICSPMKASRHTLLSSGSFLGLAPHGTLSRLPGHNILQQLKKSNSISADLWSITLLDSENGILSLGDTIAKQMERAKIQAALELQRFGDPATTQDWVEQEVDSKLAVSMPDHLPMEAHFKWTNIQGAAGWWTALMTGVWVNDAKVLKNQPVLFDIQCPFILAPPAAASRFYDALGGVIQLPAPHDGFFAFPCLNQVNIAFELGGWRFPSMSGEGTRADALHGPAGGHFSLGKVRDGSGYCIGSVVETKMGMKKRWEHGGMQDMWVLGEPFFRGLGVVFDTESGRIGVRSY